jgi:hypothetical protein
MRLQKNTPVLYELETMQGQQALVRKRVMKQTKKERESTSVLTAFISFGLFNVLWHL